MNTEYVAQYYQSPNNFSNLESNTSSIATTKPITLSWHISAAAKRNISISNKVKNLFTNSKATFNNGNQTEDGMIRILDNGISLERHI